MPYASRCLDLPRRWRSRRGRSVPWRTRCRPARWSIRRCRVLDSASIAFVAIDAETVFVAPELKTSPSEDAGDDGSCCGRGLDADVEAVLVCSVGGPIRQPKAIAATQAPTASRTRRASHPSPPWAATTPSRRHRWRPTRSGRRAGPVVGAGFSPHETRSLGLGAGELPGELEAISPVADHVWWVCTSRLVASIEICPIYGLRHAGSAP